MANITRDAFGRFASHQATCSNATTAIFDDALLAELAPPTAAQSAEADYQDSVFALCAEGGFRDQADMQSYINTMTASAMTQCVCSQCKAATKYLALSAKRVSGKPASTTKPKPKAAKHAVEFAGGATAPREFTERGINMVPDSECTDMGNYVIWNAWKPGLRLYVGEPANATREYAPIEEAGRYYYGSMEEAARAIAAEQRWAHPTKRVRITGWATGQGRTPMHIEYFVDPSGRQCRRVYKSDGSEYDYNSYGTMVFTEKEFERVAKVPKAVRRTEITRRLNSLAESGRISNDSYLVRTAMLSTPIATPYLIWRSGLVVNRNSYVGQKGRFKKLGALVARCIATAPNDAPESDVTQVIAALGRMVDEGGALRRMADQVVETWNSQLGGGDELTIGSCCHVFRTTDGHDVAAHRGDEDATATVCWECFEDSYIQPEDSDTYYHRSALYQHSDGEWYTFREAAGNVMDYTTNVLSYLPKARINSSQYGDFLMGVELEVAPYDSDYRDTAVKHTKPLTEGYAILKNDGSLPRGGFEIVTAPRGLAEHIERFKAWEPHDSLRAWDNGRCGMHVHIDSLAFSGATLGKFIGFINSQGNDELMIAIAGRHPTTDSNAAHYCRREGMRYTGNPKQTLAGKETNRYHMVNTCNLSDAEAERLGLTGHESNRKNYNTVELRIFRASLNKHRLLAQIEFAHAAVMFCRVASMRDVSHKNFLAWLRGAAPQYPHLARWFGVRANTSVVEPNPKARQEAEV